MQRKDTANNCTYSSTEGCKLPTYKRSLRIWGWAGMAGGGEGEGGSSAGYVMRFDSESLLLLESRLTGRTCPFSRVILIWELRRPSSAVVDDQCGGLCNQKGGKLYGHPHSVWSTKYVYIYTYTQRHNKIKYKMLQVYHLGITPATSSRLLTIALGVPSWSTHPLPALSTQIAFSPALRAPMTSKALLRSINQWSEDDDNQTENTFPFCKSSHRREEARRRKKLGSCNRSGTHPLINQIFCRSPVSPWPILVAR